MRFTSSALGSTLDEINGDPVDAQGRSIATGDFPVLVLGSDANDFVPFGVVTNGAQGQTADTGLFTENDDMTTAPSLDLELVLGRIKLDEWRHENGAVAGGSRFFVGGPNPTRVFADPMRPATSMGPPATRGCAGSAASKCVERATIASKRPANARLARRLQSPA